MLSVLDFWLVWCMFMVFVVIFLLEFNYFLYLCCFCRSREGVEEFSEFVWDLWSVTVTMEARLRLKIQVFCHHGSKASTEAVLSFNRHKYSVTMAALLRSQPSIACPSILSITLFTELRLRWFKVPRKVKRKFYNFDEGLKG